MIKIIELNSLVGLLSKAGIGWDKADDLVIRALKKAQDEKIPVIKALGGLSSSDAHENSDEYHLYIALKEVSVIELNKLTSLNTTPE